MLWDFRRNDTFRQNADNAKLCMILNNFLVYRANDEEFSEFRVFDVPNSYRLVCKLCPSLQTAID